MRIKKLMLLTCFLCPGFALAQEFGVSPYLDYIVGLRAQYHENVTRTAQIEADDVVVSPFFQFGIKRPGARLDANVNGMVYHDTYLDDTFDDEFLASITANLLWRVSDERLHWVFQESATVSPINQRDLQNPGNQQQTNALTTGPDLIFRLGGSNRLVIGARYNDFYAEESDDDNDGFTLSAAWNRQISSGRAISVNFHQSSIDFSAQGAVNSDYDRSDLFLAYSDQRVFSAVTHQFNVQFGYSEVEYDAPGRLDYDSPSIRVSWDRTSAGSGSFRVSLVQEIGDIASDVRNIDQALDPNSIFATAVTADPFKRQAINLSYARSWGRLSFQSSAFFDDMDYDVQILDQNYYGIGVTAGFQLRPLLTLTSAANWATRDYSDLRQSDDFVSVSLGLGYQRTRHWSVGLAASWTDRDSNQTELSADNLSVLASLQYRR